MTLVAVLLAAALLSTAAALVVVTRRHAEFARRQARLFDLDSRGSGAELTQRLDARLPLRVRAAAAALDDVRRRERRLALVLDTMTQGAVVVDADGGVVLTNTFASSFFGARHSDAVVEGRLNQLLDGARRGEAGEDELVLFGPPRRSLLLHALPLLSGDDETVGAVVLIDDVTDHQRLDAIRRDFVANIGHELKTPVGAISLLADTLEGESDVEVVRRLGERISREVLRLGRTVEDLLEFSRIEHDERAERDIVAVQDVLDEAADRHRIAASRRRVEVSVNRPVAPIEMWADRRQLVSAVSNLIDNAVKFSEPGATVVVRSRAVGDTVVIEVRDTGRGIPRRELDRVFERFYRVDSSRRRDAGDGGVGLGLAIVRHVAANHGGTVSVSSVEGEGSVFTLTMPVAFSATDEPIAESMREDS